MNQRYLREYVLHGLPRYARDKWEHFDPDDVLHHAGLTTYKPGRMLLSGVGAFLLGAIAGGVVAMLLAPKSGSEIRTNVKDKAMGYLGKQGVGPGSEKTTASA